ncbi:hypothetical protein JOC74_001255 [Bacillus capparidis]|uniref:Uncharacterized protein n=1 Tax=Bacillus capparidis TaxID=1840411 RepID=A0ABS4CTB1_9BACI|nr:hypothetical protein [Bacillus capparidis]
MINKKKLTVEKAKKNFKWYRKYLPLIGVLCWVAMTVTEYLIGTFKGTDMMTNDFLIYSVLKLLVIIVLVYLIKWKYDAIASIWEDNKK